MTQPQRLSRNTLVLQRRRNQMQNTLRPYAGRDMSRHLSFERCFNFRDIGGYATEDGGTVRWRRVFRSMTPEWMTPADTAEARTLGIELVVDLRGPDYATSGPLGETPGRRVAIGPRRGEFRDHPAWPAMMDADAVEAMPMVLDLYAAHFALAVTEMTKARGPVLYHCSFGKDRTGTLSALLLSCCGVSDRDIVADYMLTEAREPMVRALVDSMRVGPPPEEGARFVRENVQAAAMEAVLRKLEAGYGGARGYFVTHGVDAVALDAWIETLIEPATGPSRLD
jgi:protein-tyrosine phosphatase